MIGATASVNKHVMAIGEELQIPNLHASGGSPAMWWEHQEGAHALGQNQTYAFGMHLPFIEYTKPIIKAAARPGSCDKEGGCRTAVILRPHGNFFQQTSAVAAVQWALDEDLEIIGPSKKWCEKWAVARSVDFSLVTSTLNVPSVDSFAMLETYFSQNYADQTIVEILNQDDTTVLAITPTTTDAEKDAAVTDASAKKVRSVLSPIEFSTVAAANGVATIDNVAILERYVRQEYHGQPIEQILDENDAAILTITHTTTADEIEAAVVNPLARKMRLKSYTQTCRLIENDCRCIDSSEPKVLSKAKVTYDPTAHPTVYEIDEKLVIPGAAKDHVYDEFVDVYRGVWEDVAEQMRERGFEIHVAVGSNQTQIQQAVNSAVLLPTSYFTNSNWEASDLRIPTGLVDGDDLKPYAGRVIDGISTDNGESFTSLDNSASGLADLKRILGEAGSHTCVVRLVGMCTNTEKNNEHGANKKIAAASINGGASWVWDPAFDDWDATQWEAVNRVKLAVDDDFVDVIVHWPVQYKSSLYALKQLDLQPKFFMGWNGGVKPDWSIANHYVNQSSALDWFDGMHAFGFGQWHKSLTYEDPFFGTDVAGILKLWEDEMQQSFTYDEFGACTTGVVLYIAVRQHLFRDEFVDADIQKQRDALRSAVLSVSEETLWGRVQWNQYQQNTGGGVSTTVSWQLQPEGTDWHSQPGASKLVLPELFASDPYVKTFATWDQRKYCSAASADTASTFSVSAPSQYNYSNFVDLEIPLGLPETDAFAHTSFAQANWATHVKWTITHYSIDGVAVTALASIDELVNVCGVNAGITGVTTDSQADSTTGVACTITVQPINSWVISPGEPFAECHNCDRHSDRDGVSAPFGTLFIPSHERNTCALDSCPAGNYRNGDKCIPCQVGSYSDGVNFVKCIECPIGTFADQTGSTACKPCSSSSTTPRIGGQRCECKVGMFADTLRATGPLPTCYFDNWNWGASDLAIPTSLLVGDDLKPYESRVIDGISVDNGQSFTTLSNDAVGLAALKRIIDEAEVDECVLRLQRCATSCSSSCEDPFPDGSDCTICPNDMTTIGFDARHATECVCKVGTYAVIAKAAWDASDENVHCDDDPVPSSCSDEYCAQSGVKTGLVCPGHIPGERGNVRPYVRAGYWIENSSYVDDNWKLGSALADPSIVETHIWKCMSQEFCPGGDIGRSFHPATDVTDLKISYHAVMNISKVTAGILTSGAENIAGRTVIAATRISDGGAWISGADLVSFCGGVGASGCSSLTLAHYIGLGECTQYSKDTACSQCDRGYRISSDESSCVPCDWKASWLFIAYLAFIVFELFQVFRSIKHNPSSTVLLSAMTIVCFQLMAFSSLGSYAFNWLEPINTLSELADIFQFELDVVHISCTVYLCMDPIFNYGLQVMGPFLLMV